MPLFLGFLSSTFGITPPGLINMTAARLGVREGRNTALAFAGGASMIVLVQTFIALIFARFIDLHPEITIMLREAGLAIFSALTIYFFRYARKKMDPRKKEVKIHSRSSRFFLGMLLSALNFFPIPFFVFISVTLASYRLFIFRHSDICSFVAGSGLGAFFAFWCYIAFFKKMESRTQFILNNMNYIIGSVTGFVAVCSLANIIEYYFF